LELQYKNTLGAASHLELTCKKCLVRYQSLVRQRQRIKKRMADTDHNMPKKRKHMEDLSSKARWKTKQIDKLNNIFQNRAIKPTMIKNSTNKSLTGKLFWDQK
jgi:hypothetical protein